VSFQCVALRDDYDRVLTLFVVEATARHKDSTVSLDNSPDSNKVNTDSLLKVKKKSRHPALAGFGDLDLV
jgi:hypothetical protein